MGSCYSRHSQHQGKYSRPREHPVNSSNMPHQMAASEARPEKARATGTATQKGRHSGFGFRMPIPARYSNNKPNRRTTDQASTEEQNSTASNMSNGNGRGKMTDDSIREPLLKAANRRSKTRQKGHPHDNGFAASSDSLTSLSSNGRSKGSKPSSKQSSLKRAYRPQGNTGSWKMIDDSSSAYSGKSGDKLLERNSRSQNTTPGLSLDDLSNGNTTASSTPVKMIPIIKAPIAVIESLETLSGGSKEDARSQNQSPKKTSDDVECTSKTHRSNRGSTGSFQSRLKGPFKRYGLGTSTGKPTTKQMNQVIPGNQGNKWVRAKSEQSDNSVRNVSRNIAQQKTALKRQTSVEKELPQKEMIECGDVKTVKPVNGISVGDGKPTKPTTGKEDCEKEIYVIKEHCVKPVNQKPISKAPATSPDALDTISIGSINSDDLMLDIDLEEYEELGSPPTVEPSKHSRTRSRSRSRSRENPHRKPLSGAMEKPADMCTGSKDQGDSGITTAPQSQLACIEPLKELATLVQVNNTNVPSTQRRQHRRATRPASFPGRRSDNLPTADVSHGGSTILKPPRQGSVCAGDDDMVTIDGFTYRHLVQDVTNFKTMLLKLKRVIQEDEFHGQNWKNGFKLSSSQPTSPYDESNKYSFAAFLEQDQELQSNSNIDDIIKENAELKLQLQGIRHQAEEQERTIMLLQQQMTKYECGYSEPGGKAYSHVATQTDKQVSGFYKAGSYRSACVRRSSSTSSQPLNRYGNRTEFREKSRNSVTDEVFLDSESFDNDDDLDLLMEEVSLGSFCLSSVGDNTSQCGERSMSMTSTQLRETPFSRKSSLTTKEHIHPNQTDSSHTDNPMKHGRTNSSHKDKEAHPGWNASSISSVENIQSHDEKQTVHSCEMENTKPSDLVESDNKETDSVPVKSHGRTPCESDQDSLANREAAECDVIHLLEGSNLPYVSKQRTIMVQSDTDTQSTKIVSHLPKSSELYSYKQPSSTSNQSELLPKSDSSVGQLDVNTSTHGDQNNVEQQHSAENNNTLLMKAKEEGKNCVMDNTEKYQLKKQHHFEELEATEVTEPPLSLELEIKKSVRSLKLPSGRITNWSNPRPPHSSGVPPPQPSQPPPQPTSVKLSKSMDDTRFGLHELPQRPTRLVDNARKHRQLPSLASVQYSTTNVAGESHASRLPRMSSCDSIGAARVGHHSRSQPVVRGRAK